MHAVYISHVLHTHLSLAFQDTVILQMGNLTQQRLLSHSVWIHAMSLQFASSSRKRGDILMHMSKCYLCYNLTLPLLFLSSPSNLSAMPRPRHRPHHSSQPPIHSFLPSQSLHPVSSFNPSCVLTPTPCTSSLSSGPVAVAMLPTPTPSSTSASVLNASVLLTTLMGINPAPFGLHLSPMLWTVFTALS
jgi:hypothetical protein